MSFNATNYLLFDKRKKELDNEILESFVPWLVTRNFTFCGNDFIDYINDTLNVYGNVFSTKEEQFMFFNEIIPQLEKRKIQYVKAPKPEPAKEQVPVPEFYSKREIDMMNKTSKYIHE